MSAHGGAKLPLTGMSVLAAPAQRCTQTGVKSLCWGSNCKVSRFFPKASAKSVPSSKRSCRLLVCGLLMSLSVQQDTIGNS